MMQEDYREAYDKRAEYVNSKSEIVRLSQQFAREFQAAQWAAQGLVVGAARHKFITRRMENMGKIRQELAQVIGDQVATETMAKILEEL
jgi:hypothetical protein